MGNECNGPQRSRQVEVNIYGTYLDDSIRTLTELTKSELYPVVRMLLEQAVHVCGLQSNKLVYSVPTRLLGRFGASDKWCLDFAGTAPQTFEGV